MSWRADNDVGAIRLEITISFPRIRFFCLAAGSFCSNANAANFKCRCRLWFAREEPPARGFTGSEAPNDNTLITHITAEGSRVQRTHLANRKISGVSGCFMVGWSVWHIYNLPEFRRKCGWNVVMKDFSLVVMRFFFSSW